MLPKKKGGVSESGKSLFSLFTEWYNMLMLYWVHQPLRYSIIVSDFNIIDVVNWYQILSQYFFFTLCCGKMHVDSMDCPYWTKSHHVPWLCLYLPDWFIYMMSWLVKLKNKDCQIHQRTKVNDTVHKPIWFSYLYIRHR